ncbi:MAG: hypothetical protein N2446_01235 [Elusimicrobiales bacterium]|nr:hypothetical protein [Elusimicrobiales bacterium]
MIILFFVKPDYIFFKKYNCSKDIDIRYVTVIYDIDNVCENVKEAFDLIKLDEKIKVFILPNSLYKFFLFWHSDELCLNIIYPSIYINQKASNDLFKNIIFFEKLYSLKLLLKIPLLSYLSIPHWKVKGYVNYIVNEIDRFYVSDICYEDKKNDFGYIEFENKVVVKYLIEMKSYNEKKLFDENLSYKVYLDEAKMYYCK